MRIALGSNTFAAPGGIETYTLTIAGHLQRLGHELWIHANEQGATSDQARGDGLRVPERAADLPPEVDACVANDAITALQLAERYPAAPLVLVCHSDTFDFCLPPRLPGLLAGVVVLYDRVERRIAGADLGVPVTRLAQPVDVERFKSLRALPEQASTVLVMGNYVHGERFAQIERACERAGLACVHVGVHAERHQTLTPVARLNASDIVIGKARVVIEAMACGRAVYTLDHNGGDGWVTPQTYAVQAADNFGGQATDVIIDEDRLAADLQQYDAAMGLANRDLAVRHHAATRHAADLAALLAGLAPRPAPVPGPLTEIARLVRTSWQHEGHAFTLYAEVERLQQRLQEVDAAARESQRAAESLERHALELTAKLQRSEAELSELRAQLARAEDHAAHAEPR